MKDKVIVNYNLWRFCKEWCLFCCTKDADYIPIFVDYKIIEFELKNLIKYSDSILFLWWEVTERKDFLRILNLSKNL